MSGCVNFFSQVYCHRVKEPIAAEFVFSLTGRAIRVWKGKNHTINSHLEWQYVLLKIVLFVGAILTVIPAIVFIVQKVIYRQQIKKVQEDSLKEIREEALSNIQKQFGVKVEKPEAVLEFKKSQISEVIEDKYKREAFIQYCRAHPVPTDYTEIQGKKKTWLMNKHVAYQLSPFFRGLFDNSMQERVSNRIQFPHNSDEALAILVKYINSGDRYVSIQNALEVYQLADQYFMPELQQAARYTLYKDMDLTQDNINPVWELATTYKDNTLLLRCAQFFLNNPPFENKPEPIPSIADILKSRAFEFDVDLEGLICHLKEYDQSALAKLAVTALGITRLTLPSDYLGKFDNWLSLFLADPACTVETLNLSNYNATSVQLAAILNASKSVRKIIGLTSINFFKDVLNKNQSTQELFLNLPVLPAFEDLKEFFEAIAQRSNVKFVTIYFGGKPLYQQEMTDLAEIISGHCDKTSFRYKFSVGTAQR